MNSIPNWFQNSQGSEEYGQYPEDLPYFPERPSDYSLGIEGESRYADEPESDVAEHEVKAIEELRRRFAANGYAIRSSTPAAALWCFGVDDIPF